MGMFLEGMAFFKHSRFSRVNRRDIANVMPFYQKESNIYQEVFRNHKLMLITWKQNRTRESKGTGMRIIVEISVI